MIDNQTTIWVVFNILVLLMLALDLGVFHRKSHVIGIKESLIWSVIWILVAMAFNVVVYWWRGSDVALEFMAGYLIERSLSVDNLFVFMVIFSYFRVPAVHQYKVLFWGILAALVLRAFFIVTGVALVERFHWIIYVFGAFLIFTGIKVALQKDEQVDPGKNPVIQLCKRCLPATDDFDGGKFSTKVDGQRLITPMFIVLVAVETTDLIFAMDSIPAVLAITLDPFIVYSSNVFAILGLRALYFALAGCMQMFHYLNYGITAILVFVGFKMILSDIFPIPVSWALGVVAIILMMSVVASMARPGGEGAAEQKESSPENWPEN